ncbi:DUF4102 domain-containing protein [Salmonella enterica subsp. salamae]|uniref:DUF4102 domain-containing protein n=5 Tax=Salmonella enterica TaxID=28901 RepID=A0A6C7DFA3_SALER|nr:integrase arm-type DNA-binding domain-containing protein [Salmonella enterica]EAA6224283.1 DUF4102 domain-containing protein [Salmonella enterica subsp. salamae]EAA8842128.1 DUF4102 domain-containing protein [Salmonella enterica subsp. enterica]ECI2498621.1 DUF4102 domain-containing protein [Salmonella enterica subsp. enterica serovar Enteritidis]HAC6504992.1 DUF4102 domain-containing protein [Salmonella enterica subsp. salamae serovar 30:1,z28:z6]AXC86790.1 DUF4102 domain-containing protei
MAVLTRPFSAFEVQKAKPGTTDYELFVITSGKKIWRFRYKCPGSASGTTITLGDFPAMQLASARTLHVEHLALLPGGIDPKILRWQEKCNTSPGR